MNEEIWLTHIAGIKLLVAAFIGWCYSRAGRGWKPFGVKFRRRVYLPLIYCVTMLITMFLRGMFNWWLLGAIIGTWGVYYGTMSGFSYGDKSWLRRLFGKHLQQFIVGAVHGGSCILIAVAAANWGVYSLCCIIPSITLGFLGGWADKYINASYKEALTGATIFLPALFLF